MTRLQSFIVTLTLVVCLGVGLLASQRSTPPKPAESTSPFPPLISAEADESFPPFDLPAIVPAAANEPAISPRKLTADDAAPVTDHPVRRVIDRLMPNASAEERQIWFEELRNLPLNAVDDLLRLRKESNLTAPLHSTTEPLLPVEREVIGNQTMRWLVRERWRLLHNLLNAETPGYRALRSQRSPLPFEISESSRNGHPDAVYWQGTRLDLRPGEMEITERRLDVAISGAGWFIVENEHGEAGYTRNGSLRLNDRRELTVPTTHGDGPLLPKITVPESTVHVFIDENGKIYGGSEAGSFDTQQPIGQILLARFFDDSELALKKDGLYYPTPAAGAMERRMPGNQIGSLREGVLERSNVNRSEQEQTLQRVEQWLKHISPQEISSSDSRRP